MNVIDEKSQVDYEKKCYNQELNLSFNNLKSIPDDVVQLKRLRILNLSNNVLTEIPNSIKKLKSLLSLDLSHNQLKHLPQSLSEISQLKYLNISNNKFSEIPPVFLESLQFLRILDLSHNEIKYFTDPPSCISNLIELNLSHNKIMKIPNWIFSVKCIIKNLDISHNELICMNENFLSGNVLIKLITKIQYLNLENCGLSSERLHFISNMTSLEILKLGNVKMKNVKCNKFLDKLEFDIFKKCINLREINLNYVYMSLLSKNVDCLKKLKCIDLEGNYLSWLPEGFCNLHSLEICNLSKNMILFLTENFCKLINLKEIYLNNNNITEIPNCFNLLVNLEYCDFYANKLEYINWSIINLKSLKGIDLEKNCLNFHSICGNEKIYKQFTSKYSIMKEHYRKRIIEKRCNIQILENDRNIHADDEHYRGSIDDDQDTSFLNNIDNKDPVQMVNWDDDRNGETSNVISSDLEHDEFDPNVNYDLKLRWKRTNEERNVFYRNFCPADNHIPSLRKYFLRKPQDVTVEGQYDLN